MDSWLNPLAPPSHTKPPQSYVEHLDLSASGAILPWAPQAPDGLCCVHEPDPPRFTTLVLVLSILASLLIQEHIYLVFSFVSIFFPYDLPPLFFSFDKACYTFYHHILTMENVF